MAESAGSAFKPLTRSHPATAAQAADTVALYLRPSSVFENGGRASVHAQLVGRAKSSTITVTVATSSGDVTQTGTTLTIPAGGTRSYGTVVLTAVDNDMPDGDRTITVTGTATGLANLVVRPGSLEVVDNEGMGKLTFRLSSSNIYENTLRGVDQTTVIVESSKPVATTVSVSVSVRPWSSNALASDYTVSGNTLVIPAGSTRSAGDITITAVDNAAWNATKTIAVFGTVDPATGLDPPGGRGFYILNDDLPAILRVRARPNTFSEASGVTTVTMTADEPVLEDIDVTLAVVLGDSSRVAFGSNRTLSIRKGETASTGSVTVTAVDGSIPHDRNATSLNIGRKQSLLPGSYVLDDQIHIYRPDRNKGWLLVSAERNNLWESDEPTAIFATLSEPPADTVKVTIGLGQFTDADPALYELSAERELTILPGATRSTGMVELRPIDNDYYNPQGFSQIDLGVTVTRGQSDVLQIQRVSNIPIRDDELPPTVTLELSPGEISEGGGTTIVTARMDVALREETTTVTIASDPVLPATAGDFTQTGTMLTIAPGAVTSTGSVTITAVDNSDDEPDKKVRVSGSVSVTSTETDHYIGRIGLPPPQHLRIADNDFRAPTPPSLIATAQGRTTIALSWLPPVFNGGSPVTGYRIEVSADAGDTWSDLAANTGNAATAYGHGDLAPETTRHYRVRAINTVGQSGPSNVASATTGAAVMPGAPTGLTASGDGRNSIRLSWTRPEDDGGSPVSGYRIEVSADAGDTWSNLVANSADTATTYTHAGLAPETTRHYRVRAISSIGESEPSNVASATTGANSEPGAPFDLEARAAGRDEIDLSWSPPPDDGGRSITGYRIEVSADAGDSWSDLVANSEDAATTYTQGGLAPGTTRHYRVRAINSLGESGPSNVASATTEANSEPGAPFDLEARAAGRDEIDLSWSPPPDDGGSAITGYRIEVSADAGDTWSNLVANSEDAATTYTHGGLAPGTTRHYRVRAINSLGESGPSNVASATTDAISEPGAPLDLVATEDGYHAIVLSWTPPLEDGGFPITGYVIEVSADAGVSWGQLVAHTSSTATTYRHAGLAAGTTRHYRVSAINDIGTGEPSNVAAATTDAAIPPSAVRDLSGMSGTTRVSLTWAPPADIGGAEIERYEYRIDGRGGWSSVGLATTTTVTGLEPGRTYLFEVRAVNLAGPGATASVRVKLNAHPAFQHSSYLFELPENEDGTASPVTLGSVLAEDPDGDRVTYEMSAAGTSLFRIEPSGGGVAYVGPGEDYESEPNRYEFTVRAYDGRGGRDSASAVVVITPVNEQPEAVDDDAETSEDRPVQIQPLDNDSDPDGDALHVESVSEAAHGTVEIVAGTTVLYSPDENWHGDDRFTYVASDGSLTDEATVSVTVLPVNDAPAAEGTIPGQMLEEGGAAVELDLSGYFSDVDGDSLIFAAASADPMVVAVALSGSMLTVTPVARGSTTIEAEATDAGGLSARQRFSVKVGDRMVKSVLADVLGAMGRGYLASMRATLSRRHGAPPVTGESRLSLFGQILPLETGSGWRDKASEAVTDWIRTACPGMAGGRGTLPVSAGSLGGPGPDGAGPPACSAETLGRAAGLGRSDLELVLAGGGPEQAAGARSAWTLWTQGDIQRFSGAGSAAGGYNGELRNAYLGLDVRDGRWLAGLAYSRSAGTGEWEIGKAGGRMATTLNTLHPYLRWSNDATSAWAMFGFGSGTAEHERDQAAVTEAAGMGLTAGLIEVRHDFRARRTGPQVGLRADAGWARLSTDPGSGTINDLDADVRQARIGMELGWQIGTPAGGLTPFGQVHLRRDDGAGQNGRGVEVLGGLRARFGAVQVDAQGRRLAIYSAGEYSESGASAALRIGASPGQPGLSLQVEPRWGARGGPSSALWQDHLYPAADGMVPEKNGIDASAGYGLPISRDRVLFPFARFAGSEQGRRLQLGVQFGSFELVGDMNHGVPGAQSRQLALVGRIGFGAGMPFTIGPTDER